MVLFLLLKLNFEKELQLRENYSNYMRLTWQSLFFKKDEDGNYVQSEKVVTTGPMKMTPVAVRGLHRQMGELALDAIEGVDQDKRIFSGLTFGLSQESFDEIVAEIDAFRERIIAIASRDDACDEVYRLNVQFFPMTCKNNK